MCPQSFRIRGLDGIPMPPFGPFEVWGRQQTHDVAPTDPDIGEVVRSDQRDGLVDESQPSVRMT
jgi:hypothetical protein